MQASTALQIVIKAELARRSWSWERLAAACESTASTIHRRAGLTVPTMKTVELLAEGLDLGAETLCESILDEARYADDEGRELRGDGMVQGHGRPE